MHWTLDPSRVAALYLVGKGDTPQGLPSLRHAVYAEGMRWEIFRAIGSNKVQVWRNTLNKYARMKHVEVYPPTGHAVYADGVTWKRMNLWWTLNFVLSGWTAKHMLLALYEGDKSRVERLRATWMTNFSPWTVKEILDVYSTWISTKGGFRDYLKPLSSKVVTQHIDDSLSISSGDATDTIKTASESDFYVASSLNSLLVQLDTLRELDANLSAIEEDFGVHYPGVLRRASRWTTHSAALDAAFTTEVTSQGEVLGKAREGLKGAKLIQEQVANVLKQYPDDKTAARVLADAETMVGRFERHEAAAAKVIRTLAKKQMPDALKKYAAKVEKLISTRLVDPEKMQVIPWVMKSSVYVPPKDR